MILLKRQEIKEGPELCMPPLRYEQKCILSLLRPDAFLQSQDPQETMPTHCLLVSSGKLRRWRPPCVNFAIVRTDLVLELRSAETKQEAYANAGPQRSQSN